MKFKIILIVVFTVAVGIWGFMNYVYKPVNDYGNQKPVATFSFETIMEKLENDTTLMNELIGKLIAIQSNIKNLNREGDALTIELGSSATLSSVTCQTDRRYQEQFDGLKADDLITLKGILSGYNLDPDQLFGNTIELKYCTLEK